MINKIFNIVVNALIKIGHVTGFTYNEINVLIYYLDITHHSLPLISEHCLPAFQSKVYQKGSMLTSDIYKGDEIEIKIEMSASRELKASVYLPRINKEFEIIYNGTLQILPPSKFKQEIAMLNDSLEFEIKEAIEREEYGAAEELTKLQKKVDELIEISVSMPDDDSTETRFVMIQQKRKLAQEIADVTKNKRIELLTIEYKKDKEWCQEILNDNGNDQDHKMFNDIVVRELIFLKSAYPITIKNAIEDLNNLGIEILWKTPEFLENKFKRLIEKPQLFNDQSQAKTLIEVGHTAIENKNYDRLRQINLDLISLMGGKKSNSDNDSKEGSTNII